VAHFVLNSGGPSEVREFGKEAVDQCAVTNGFDAKSVSCLVVSGKAT
jgi:hypothetical protein